MSLPQPPICEQSPDCCEGSAPFYGQGISYLSAQGGLKTPCPPGFICEPGFYPPGVPFRPTPGNPLRLMTCDGVEIVRYLPDQYSQAQYNAIAQDMADIAAIHLAKCNGTRPDVNRIFFENDEQHIECEDGTSVVIPEGSVIVPVEIVWLCDDARPPLTITTSEFLGACLGISFEIEFKASGGTPYLNPPFFEPTYLLRLIKGDFPPGTHTKSIVNGRVFLVGIPTASGFFEFTIEFQDAQGLGTHNKQPNRVAKKFHFRVLEITDNSPLPGGTVGVAYAPFQFSNIGTKPGIVWWPLHTFGDPFSNVPAGLSLSLTGEISGTPTLAGTFTFFVNLRDNNGPPDFTPASNSVTCQKKFTIVIV